MRRHYISDVRDIFQTAIDHINSDNPNTRESEISRIEKLQRDVISDLYKLDRVEKSLEDAGNLNWGNPNFRRPPRPNNGGRNDDDGIDWGNDRDR
jgi:hypothetical protein